MAKNGGLAHYNPKLITHAIGRNIEFCSPTKFWFKQIKITKLAADPGEEEVSIQRVGETDFKE